MAKRARALTLVEALILAGLLVLIAVLAVPQVQGARIATNETAAVALVRALREAYRTAAEEAGTPPSLEQTVALLRKTFPDAALLPPPADGGPPLIAHHGYLFVLFPRVVAEEERAGGLRDLGIYAWPREVDASGTAAFFLDGKGRILFTRNLVQRYSGLHVRPEPQAALPRLTAGRPGPNGADPGHQGKDDQRWDPLPADAS